MGIEEAQGRSVTETILPEDGPFTYIGKHPSGISATMTWEKISHQ